MLKRSFVVLAVLGVSIVCVAPAHGEPTRVDVTSRTDVTGSPYEKIGVPNAQGSGTRWPGRRIRPWCVVPGSESIRYHYESSDTISVAYVLVNCFNLTQIP